MIEKRLWVHTETPEEQPSAASYRTGCRCHECVEANKAYMRDYRARRVAHKENTDGTTVYHSHKGQPSKRTARKHLCIHPRCLDLADLRLDQGIVVDKATGKADATFGSLASIIAKAVA